MKILFLDCDGVLNCHDRHLNGYCGLHAYKLALLDCIVCETGCRIVIASSWRYLYLCGSMTSVGFGHLLSTHGASKCVVDALYDFLPEDQVVNDMHDRGKLATWWLNHHASRCREHVLLRPITACCALDDGSWPDGFDLGYEIMGIPSVRPKPTVGLTAAEAEQVIAILNKEPTDAERTETTGAL